MTQQALFVLTYLIGSGERITEECSTHIPCECEETADSKAESSLLMKIHHSIRAALRQVMNNESLPAEERKQAEELLAALIDYIDRDLSGKPCSDRMALAERENAMDRLWMLFEDEQLQNLEALQATGIDLENTSHRLTAETAVSVALAELVHRKNRRLVEQLEVKISELR